MYRAANARKYLHGELDFETANACATCLLELVCLKIFNEDLFFRLNLQQLEEETHKFGRLLVPINTTDRPNFDGEVD
jgi:hypothetical protein